MDMWKFALFSILIFVGSISYSGEIRIFNKNCYTFGKPYVHANIDSRLSSSCSAHQELDLPVGKETAISLEDYYGENEDIECVYAFYLPSSLFLKIISANLKMECKRGLVGSCVCEKSGRNHYET